MIDYVNYKFPGKDEDFPIGAIIEADYNGTIYTMRKWKENEWENIRSRSSVGTVTDYSTPHTQILNPVTSDSYINHKIHLETVDSQADLKVVHLNFI